MSMKKDQIAPATAFKTSTPAQRTHPGVLVAHEFLSHFQQRTSKMDLPVYCFFDERGSTTGSKEGEEVRWLTMPCLCGHQARKT